MDSFDFNSLISLLNATTDNAELQRAAVTHLAAAMDLPAELASKLAERPGLSLVLSALAARIARRDEDNVRPVSAMPSATEGLALNRAFTSIPDAKVRERLIFFLSEVAKLYAPQSN